MNASRGDWTTVRVSDVALVQGGIQKQAKRRPVRNKYPFLRVANVLRGSLELGDVHEIELFNDEINRFRLEAGDLLVVEGNGSPDQIGRAALWDGSISDCVHQNHLIRVRPSSKILPKFLAYAWNSPTTSAHLRSIAGTTSGLYTLSTAKIKSVEIPICDVDQQRRVVSVLEDHISRIDAAEVGLRRSMRRLSALQHAFLSSVLLGAAVSGPRECKLVPEVGIDDGASSPLPHGWQWLRLGDVADVVGGVTKDSKRQSDPAFVEVPYLRVANVQRGHLNLDNVATIRVAPKKADALRLQPGDVLLNEGGDRDKLARGWIWEGQIDPCIHQNHVFRARVRGGLIDPRLLSWAANTLGAPWAERNGKQTTNLASISLSKIRLMPIPVPPLEIQPGLVQQISDQLAGIDRLAKQVVSNLVRSQALRSSLLEAAFSGRLIGRASDVDMVEELAGV